MVFKTALELSNIKRLTDVDRPSNERSVLEEHSITLFWINVLIWFINVSSKSNRRFDSVNKNWQLYKILEVYFSKSSWTSVSNEDKLAIIKSLSLRNCDVTKSLKESNFDFISAQHDSSSVEIEIKMLLLSRSCSNNVSKEGVLQISPWLTRSIKIDVQAFIKGEK